MGIKAELIQKIQSKTMTMGVCGLGYVGLPLAVDKANSMSVSKPLALMCRRKKSTW